MERDDKIVEILKACKEWELGENTDHIIKLFNELTEIEDRMSMEELL